MRTAANLALDLDAPHRVDDLAHRLGVLDANVGPTMALACALSAHRLLSQEARAEQPVGLDRLHPLEPCVGFHAFGVLGRGA